MNIQEIRSAMLAAGVEPPARIEVDGRLQWGVGK